MRTTLGPRVALLATLAVVGVGLAMVGTTLGATAGLADTDRGSAFVVADGTITFEHGDRQATVVGNLTHLEEVQIERQGTGTFRITTNTSQPVTETERSLARTVVRNNATVRGMLADLDGYELHVEPIHKLTMDQTMQVNLTRNDTRTGSADGQATFTMTSSNENATVTVDRTPTYVEGRVNVRVVDPGNDATYYSIDVDLENETVTDVTDWSDI